MGSGREKGIDGTKWVGVTMTNISGYSLVFYEILAGISDCICGFGIERRDIYVCSVPNYASLLFYFFLC
jgi:hypothetical protein